MKKDRISALYKLYFERKTDSDNENESSKRNRINNDNTIIPRILKKL